MLHCQVFDVSGSSVGAIALVLACSLTVGYCGCRCTVGLGFLGKTDVYRQCGAVASSSSQHSRQCSLLCC